MFSNRWDFINNIMKTTQVTNIRETITCIAFSAVKPSRNGVIYVSNSSSLINGFLTSAIARSEHFFQIPKDQRWTMTSYISCYHMNLHDILHISLF